MKKRILCLLLALCAIFCMSACDKTPTTNPDATDTGENTTADAAPAGPVELVSDGTPKYSIILSKDSSAAVVEASTALMNTIKELTGRKPERKYDDTEKNPETPNEILLGVTSRKESKESLKKLKEDEILIEWNGTKLVILVANEQLLTEALATLAATWTVTGKTITLPATLSLQQDLGEGMIPLTEGGKLKYSLVYPASADTSLKLAVSSLATRLGAAFSDEQVNMSSDNKAAADYEILIGQTNRAESVQAYSALHEIGYRVSILGNKITVAATDAAMLDRAVDALASKLEWYGKGVLVGDAKMKSDLSLGEVSEVCANTWYTAVPVPTEGMTVSGFSPDANSCIFERVNATSQGFDTYLNALTAAGFADGEDYTVEGNRYALRHGEESTVYVSYSDKAKTVRLHIEKKGTTTAPPKTDGTTGTMAPVLYQLAVDVKGSALNGGMSYVLRTATGSFIVIDGGYETVAEADHLYRLLKENTPAGKETVIDAWYLSHLHGDHYGGLYAFAEKYADEIDVKAFYYRVDYRGAASPKQSEVEGFMKKGKWSDAVHYNGLQTGMEFSIGGVNFTVLHTLIDLYPSNAANSGFDFNDTSTVIRVTAGGQRIMFLGDMMDDVSLCMEKYLPAAALKADIVQLSHHGYEGAYRWIYDSIAAPTVLWPLNVVGYQTNYQTVPQNVVAAWINQSNGTHFQNKYVFSEATYVKKVIIAGMGDVALTLPYTPEGEKIPDYNAYYEAHKND